ncbi:MAG: GTP-binding protein LepA, GTP-binding protein LepA [Candidatus Wolfebacteria bacterium GW2011_GWC1_43_10]|uniref:GTP-binding protein LepA, GTP-binding protein LepA n=1 Tax=Candidatus Wolfebacteria bacterium GW2011_GWC1_43_10 TaxID=1619011 RepID=A0A0G1C7B2_9BACT|nr:MAG: GTP-binding protein LepA, GTP-binding protein LepA [Candidatus Wolfebacteria bacterium GW2011_GWC1_43_10]
MANIRNFCIIAHIDHGKSTLADRFLEITGTIEKRQMKAQYLDQLELERERGITIKMAPVRMTYKLTTNDQRPEAVNQKSSVVSRESSSSEYILNLIDTPGHPDFGYEVSRALEAVEGAILLVDGTQGIQAQTLSSFYAAKKSGLKIIGAVNKVDLFQQTRTETDITRTVSDIAQTGAESSRLDSVIEDLAYLIDCSPEEIHKISGKTGQGVRELLNDIVARVPSPQAYLEKSQQLSVSSRQLSVFSRALIFDSFYDDHKGIIASVRVFDGEFTQLEDVFLIAAREKFRVKEVGYFSPSLVAGKKLAEGEIGYLVTGIRLQRAQTSSFRFFLSGQSR